MDIVSKFWIILIDIDINGHVYNYLFFGIKFGWISLNSGDNNNWSTSLNSREYPRQICYDNTNS